MLSEKFESYLNHPGDFESISNNYITEILIDRKANLWVGTRGGGLNQFFTVENKFSCIKDDPDRGLIVQDDFITAIFEDSSENIWFGHNGVGLNKLEYSKGKYHYRFFNFNNDKILLYKNYL